MYIGLCKQYPVESHRSEMIPSFTFFLGSVLLSQDVCVAHIGMRTKAMLCVLRI